MLDFYQKTRLAPKTVNQKELRKHDTVLLGAVIMARVRSENTTVAK